MPDGPQVDTESFTQGETVPPQRGPEVRLNDGSFRNEITNLVDQCYRMPTEGSVRTPEMLDSLRLALDAVNLVVAQREIESRTDIGTTFDPHALAFASEAVALQRKELQTELGRTARTDPQEIPRFLRAFTDVSEMVGAGNSVSEVRDALSKRAREKFPSNVYPKIARQP